MSSLKQILTPRQFESAAFVSQGYNNPEITKLMKIELNTVKKIISRAFDKAGVGNRVELAVR